MRPALTISSSLRKMSSLSGSFSVTASTAKSTGARSVISCVVLIRARVSPTSDSGIAPFLACRSRFCRMVCKRLFELRLGNIVEHDLIAVLGEDVGDAVAHLPRAKHADCRDHVLFLL